MNISINIKSTNTLPFLPFYDRYQIKWTPYNIVSNTYFSVQNTQVKLRDRLKKEPIK